MDIHLDKEGFVSRAQLWAATWVAVATSSNCTYIESPTKWADECLREFDKRFTPRGSNHNN